MNNSQKRLFTSFKLGHVELPVRAIRAATFEGMADREGAPKKILGDMYEKLAKNGVPLIVTGFAYTSMEGRGMQPGQTGIDSDDKIGPWKKITQRVKPYGTKICMQITHAGRQTNQSMTKQEVVGVSNKKCTYFKQKVRSLKDKEIEKIIDQYALASKRAKKAGFDGVQIHCAHGYLIHQFLSPHTNTRKDKWGGDHRRRFNFCDRILKRVRELCGKDFLILTKISWADDRGLTIDDSIKYSQMMEESGVVDGIVISYGTMEYAINIFRGDIPLKIAMKHNPLFNKYSNFSKWLWTKFYYPIYLKKIFPFKENYNVEMAKLIAESVDIPVLVTGGIRSKSSIENILKSKIAAVSLCRPLICEPDLLTKLGGKDDYDFKCTNCNYCTMMCDSQSPTRCYRKR